MDCCLDEFYSTFTMSQHVKKHIVSSIALVFIFLFTYTAASKLNNMNGLIGSITRHPLLSTFAEVIAWSIISLEIIAALLLFYALLRLYGLWLSASLMLAFTGYIGSMFWLMEKLPCSCGGILKELSWSSHFILNVLLTVIAIAGIILERQYRDKLGWEELDKILQ